MREFFKVAFIGITCFTIIEASRILVCVPTSSLSHQVVFYPLVKELLKRGHEVVFITTDAIYPKGQAPANLTEIDTHDVSYKPWKEEYKYKGETVQGDKTIQYWIMSTLLPIIVKSFEEQMLTQEVQDLIQKKTKFDLIIVEALCKSAISLSHVFKAPLILMSSLGGFQDNYNTIGAPIYPKLLYPSIWHQKLNNLTIVDKIRVLWDSYKIEKFLEDLQIDENKLIKRLFGSDIPSLAELSNNVEMLFLNEYHIWNCNRPVPPSVLFIGGIHKAPQKDLPKDLKDYLDASERGVVYFSMGTNVSPSRLPQKKIQHIVNALARLNYDVLLKWDSDGLPGKGNNTRVAVWFPQIDVLRHPKIKAFVTQGGLQSFDEALIGGVPFVGIPMLGDQWYNVERYEALKIGVGITEDLTEDLLVDAVNAVIDDPSYRQNVIQLRDSLHDQPETALDRAVWWVEHVIRHKGASHLRAAAANMSWPDYLDLELISAIFVMALVLIVALYVIIYSAFQYAVRFVKLKKE